MDQLLIPMKVDCFILNEAVCSPKPEAVSSSAKIAPITQPNYTYLRYDKKYLANDILRHTDLHATSRAATNSRIYDLGSGKAIPNRQGVYVHWMIPRPYRSGTTSSDAKATGQDPKGGILTDEPGLETDDTDTFPSTSGSDDDPVVEDPNKKDPYLKVPSFPDIPTRWLVIRRIDLNTVKPDGLRTGNLVPELTGWIVESDHMQMIDDIDDSIDLQTDVSPYIDPKSKQTMKDGKLTDQINIDHQAEVFIGSKWPADTWAEDGTHSRATINIGQGSNQLFADLQTHNGNVFSMVDNMYCTDGETRIMEATCSYFVLGWHTADNPDLFSITKGTRGQRLEDLNMVLRDAGRTEVTNWAANISPARTLCHGSKYEVKWSMNDAPWIPANDYCASLMEASRLSVATTPLDSILTYVHAHAADADETTRALARNLELIEAMLLARDDGVELLQRAVNFVSNNNFRKREGGRYLYLADDDGKSAPKDNASSTSGATDSTGSADSASSTAILASGKPALGKHRVYTAEEISIIKQFNKAFSKMDTMTSLTNKLRWDMFGLWWFGVSDRGENRDIPKLRDDIVQLRTRFQKAEDDLKGFALDKEGNNWKGVFPDESQGSSDDDKMKSLETLRSSVFKEAKVGVQSPFFQPSDPTLLVAGVPSGWPQDYLDKLVVRLGFQSSGESSTPNLDKSCSSFIGNLATKLPGDFGDTVKALFEEFYLLQSTDYIPKASRFPPLYHDKYPIHNTQPGRGTSVGRGTDGKELWRDRWNDEQPFFPLYFEWEVDYYHIPYEYWRLEDTSVDQTHPSKARYTIDTERFKSGQAKVEGMRRFSGRSLILPQPSLSLKAKVDALYAQLPAKTLDDLIDIDKRRAIDIALQQLPFLSSPLSGFADNLLTKLQGTHVKCNNKGPTGESVPIQMAIDASPRDGPDPIIKRDDLALIQSESDMTPYGSLVQYSDDRSSAFKPVTHGQFRFTKLNIIDKFGQAIHATNPDPKATTDYEAPCRGEYYTAQEILETVGDTYDFIQIPPQINQPARLNASFVRLTRPAPNNLYWEPLIEWENPVWGWVVINYANYGLQFYLPDGTFYREVRKGGRIGALGSTEWLPFPPPAMGSPGSVSGSDPDTVKQLQNLIVKLSTDAGYLEAFVGVIDNCMSTLLPAPAGYASQSSAAIGRPLALVNMGWSLELATEAYKTQILTGTTSLPRKLANDDSFLDKDTGENFDEKSDTKGLYSFRIKFGSREKAWDALVGYFPSKNRGDIKDNGDALDLEKFYTYYAKTSDKRFLNIDDDPYRFRPFYFDPWYQDRRLDDLAVLRAKRQHVFGALMDPFAPVHAYSSILPIKELSLPPWVMDQAFARMTAFFSIGPVLIPKQLPIADDDRQVPLTEIVDDDKPIAEPKLGLPVPVSTLGGWSWLQPYPSAPAADPHASSPDNAPSSAKPQRFYNQFKLDKADQRMRFEDGPYTAVEGFLQLRSPTEKATPNPVQTSS